MDCSSHLRSIICSIVALYPSKTTASSSSPMSRIKNPFGEWALILSTSSASADFQKVRNSFSGTIGVPFSSKQDPQIAKIAIFQS